MKDLHHRCEPELLCECEYRPLMLPVHHESVVLPSGGSGQLSEQTLPTSTYSVRHYRLDSPVQDDGDGDSSQSSQHLTIHGQPRLVGRCVPSPVKEAVHRKQM